MDGVCITIDIAQDDDADDYLERDVLRYDNMTSTVNDAMDMYAWKTKLSLSGDGTGVNSYMECGYRQMEQLNIDNAGTDIDDFIVYDTLLSFKRDELKQNVVKTLPLRGAWTWR